jgi:hypothetical protein
MLPVLVFLLVCFRDSLRTRVTLQAEILALRHQVLVLQRRNQKHRVLLSDADRLRWVWLSRIWPDWRAALRIVKPETVIAWHRKGFRLYWSWKSRPRPGRPPVSTEVRELIRRMNAANPGWGAPRIHGELGKLGIIVSETTVAKYMVRHRCPASQAWRTFLSNHAKDLVSADFFVVPTATFRLLFVFVILSHDPSGRCWLPTGSHVGPSPSRRPHIASPDPVSEVRWIAKSCRGLQQSSRSPFQCPRWCRFALVIPCMTFLNPRLRTTGRIFLSRVQGFASFPRSCARR